MIPEEFFAQVRHHEATERTDASVGFASKGPIIRVDLIQIRSGNGRSDRGLTAGLSTRQASMKLAYAIFAESASAAVAPAIAQ